MKTYEIFTEKCSEIVQAHTIYDAINKWIDDDDYNFVQNIIAIVEHERGQEFLRDTGKLNKQNVSIAKRKVCDNCGTELRTSFTNVRGTFCSNCYLSQT